MRKMVEKKDSAKVLWYKHLRRRGAGRNPKCLQHKELRNPIKEAGFLRPQC